MHYANVDSRKVRIKDPAQTKNMQTSQNILKKRVLHDSYNDHVIFQHLDTIFEKKQVIIVGRTKKNHSVAVKLNNVKPHIVIGYYDGCIDYLKRYIRHSKFMKKCRGAYYPRVKPDEMDLDMEFNVIQGQDIVSPLEHKKSTFLKITCSNVWDYWTVKRIVQGKQFDVPLVFKYGKQIDIHDFNTFEKKYSIKKKQTSITECKIYNDQVNIPLQYFIENDLYSCSWFKVCGALRENCDTTCDLEYEGHVENCNVTGMAPWKIFSFDIESLPPPRENNPGKFDFPKPEKDPIITICGTLTLKQLEYHAWILCPDGLDYKLYDVDGFEASTSKVYSFVSEKEMLLHFVNFINTQDIDFIQGHNCIRFDADYIIKRLNTLECTGINMSRLKKHQTKIDTSTFSSSQKGSIDRFKLAIPGRVVLDSYDIMKDQHNESSYKLDNLAQKYLGTKKVPMDYDKIYPKFQTYQGRLELAVYCLKDAWLVHALLEKLCKLNVILQMANVTGISMKDVIDRGQGIRTIALMIRYSKKHSYFIPRVKPNKEEETFKGAVVVDPTVGYYTDAVSCLDFASLYPSIMQAMNMSYETLVSNEKIKKMNWIEGEDVRTIPDYELVDGKLKITHNPNNPSFVTSKVRLGLLPEMLETLLAERKKVKKMMKAEVPHSTMYNVYNGRQLGLKVVCNSIYGFTGASVGFLPCKLIASSVTKYGRGLTLKTKSIIENHEEWGKNGHGCKCIYGDTDSVFVHMPRSLVNGKDREELIQNAHKMGEKMAEYITGKFLNPVFLEYEKTYCPYLLLKKKRYAGYKYEPGLPPKLHLKGIEAVRRDFAPLLVDTQKKLLNTLIIEQNVQKGCTLVHNIVKDLFMDKLPLNMFIMSKKLSRDPADYASKGPHVQLALKLAKKDPVQAPVSGDRVEYVIHIGSKMMSERACLPKDIIDGKHMVDLNYYFEKQLKAPMLRIFKVIKEIRNPEQYFKTKAIKKRLPTGKNMFAHWKKKPRIVQ